MTIYSKFINLKSDKQKEIINAAIMEFVQSGFEKASTNEIVKRSNISKGSLFNYFNSKKDLYVYLIEYSVQIDRKSTRLNSSHVAISYAVFCLKKKNRPALQLTIW